jgi:hypothetical protein
MLSRALAGRTCGPPRGVRGMPDASCIGRPASGTSKLVCPSKATRNYPKWRIYIPAPPPGALSPRSNAAAGSPRSNAAAGSPRSNAAAGSPRSNATAGHFDGQMLRPSRSGLTLSPYHRAAEKDRLRRAHNSGPPGVPRRVAMAVLSAGYRPARLRAAASRVRGAHRRGYPGSGAPPASAHELIPASSCHSGPRGGGSAPPGQCPYLKPART